MAPRTNVQRGNDKEVVGKCPHWWYPGYGYMGLFCPILNFNTSLKLCQNMSKKRESSPFNTTYLRTTASVTTRCLMPWSPLCYLAARPCPSSLPPQRPGTAIRAVLTPTNHQHLPVGFISAPFWACCLFSELLIKTATTVACILGSGGF